jgi:tRNA 2-thiouridine synthesizing protein D
LNTLTIVLTDGPYISEYAEMGYKIAIAALKEHRVNVFLYLDAVHIRSSGRALRNLRMSANSFGSSRKEVQ